MKSLSKSLQRSNLSHTPNTISGLVAIKLADLYQRPCLILKKYFDGTYGGSARNTDSQAIENLKETLLTTELFEFCQGHGNAFGFNIKKENINTAIEYCNLKFNDIDFNTYSVDFEIDFNDFSIAFIREIDSLKDFWGTGLKEPLVVIKGITVNKNQCSLMGKENDTWKLITDENITFVKFKNSEDDKVLQFMNSDSQTELTINAICKVGFNEYKGILTPQAEIKEYEVM